MAACPGSRRGGLIMKAGIAVTKPRAWRGRLNPMLIPYLHRRPGSSSVLSTPCSCSVASYEGDPGANRGSGPAEVGAPAQRHPPVGAGWGPGSRARSSPSASRERYVGGKNRNGGQSWADGRRWGNGAACWILTAPAPRQPPGEGDRAARATPPRGRSRCHPSNPAGFGHHQLSLRHPGGWGQREDGPEPASTRNPSQNGWEDDGCTAPTAVPRGWGLPAKH